MNTKSEASCTANDIMRQAWKHEFGKDVVREITKDQSLFCRKSTQLVINGAFASAVVFPRMMRVRKRCPVLHVSLPVVYDIMAHQWAHNFAASV